MMRLWESLKWVQRKLKGLKRGWIRLYDKPDETSDIATNKPDPGRMSLWKFVTTRVTGPTEQQT